MNRTSTLKRLQNEINKLKTGMHEYEHMFEIDMVDDNMYHWRAILYGPEDSLYEGCKFELDVILPDNYPFFPIKVKFITPIQHINVNANGDICLDILKDQWTSSQTITTVMISIRLLLSTPNTNDAFNSELAEIYRTNKKMYTNLIKKTCKCITHGKK
ncbi:MAG: putative ubiquitin-conjugating enzyme E2 [Satyrvirus sp.]|uniref:E2 ubiquitin-conjugating enzyme n=1 Tax=Satyrvirus sp. TaxID=2487771 RepID=A0A3G5ADN4_9VIRU|nr:MAG: putative ubiquitin-conjugating enzyme E2 [Satyrvirus sp.]